MFGGEHKQTDIAQSAIFTTGSMRASRFYPAILLSFLIMYGDFSFDISSKIRIVSSYIFSPFTQIEYLAKDSFNSFDSYFFLCDLDGHIDDQKVQKSLEELGLHCEDFHVLGVFEADKIREK